MFKIGEFSKLTQVSVRMLRYYDETGLFKPAQIDKFTGYRSYSVDQIPILHRIIFLRDSGFQVSEIAAVLKKWDSDSIIEELEIKQRKSSR
jgi:DNA-binding transcriptional MerR regulator